MQRELGWAIQWVEHSHIFGPTDDIQLTNKRKHTHGPDSKHNPHTPTARRLRRASTSRRRVSMTREYDTPEYKRARRDLLASSPDCHWCGGVATEADHLIEQDAGGDHTTMVPSCKSCNSRRGAQYVNRKTAQRMQQRKVAMTKNKTDFFSTPNSPRAPSIILSPPAQISLNQRQLAMIGRDWKRSFQTMPVH